MVETCYACMRPATSLEHVPPQCLFPQARDVTDGRDYRRKLITVPACDEHNSEKSTDDEFFRLVLCSSLGANQVAMLQVRTKIARSVARSPALVLSVLKDGRDVNVTDSATGAVHEATLVPIDVPRLMGMLKLIVRGLFLHRLGQKWDGEISIHCEMMGDDDDAVNREQEEDRRLLHLGANELFASAPQCGDNPEVFCFRIQRGRDGIYAMRLMFYGGCRFTALLSPEDKGGIHQFLVAG